LRAISDGSPPFISDRRNNLRKLFIGALAMGATVALGSGVAHSQGNGVVFKAKATPTKVGTKKKPKNAALNVNMTVNRPGTTVEFIDLTLPRGLKISGKGLGNCTPDDLAFGGPEACADDAAGRPGTASAALGAQGAPLNFTVQPFVQDANTLVFYVASEQGSGISVESPITGEITGGGRKLRIQIPPALREPVPGVDASLTSLNQTFSAKKGKRRLVTTTGCKGGKFRYTGKLTFSARADAAPVPPPSTATTSSTCRK
jgi:hypothetical protein